MDRMLNDDIIEQIKEIFQENLTEPVQVIFFEDDEHCDYCAQTRQILEEIVVLDTRLTLETHHLVKEPAVAKHYKVDKAPAIVLAGKNGSEIVDYDIRFYGIPAGHEFTSLINDMILVSSRESGLSPATKAFLKKNEQQILLQVFVTPTWPYCPRAVTLAHAMALESPYVQAEMIEATEFQQLAGKYNVSGVPHTAINENAAQMIGSGPEEMLLAEILKVIKN